MPNDGRAHHGYKLREGLVIDIEPWFLKTTDEIFQDPKDGWTLRASDGSRRCGLHSGEHTIAITENGPIVHPIAPTSDWCLAYGRCLIGL